MQPQATKADQYQPRWRHFHPQSTVWVQNPFDHDVVFQVADEHNVPYQYRLPANKVCELPGGMVATLGVKEIVDELIQNTKGQELRLYEEAVRKEHEDKIILREKVAPLNTNEINPSGEIDLSIRGDVEEKEEPAPKAKVSATKAKATKETAFPDLKAKSAVADIAGASLSDKDQVVEAD